MASEIENNNSVSNANLLSPGVDTSGLIRSSDLVDYFKVDTSLGQPLRFWFEDRTTTTHPWNYPSIRFYDDVGNRLYGGGYFGAHSVTPRETDFVYAEITSSWNSLDYKITAWKDVSNLSIFKTVGTGYLTTTTLASGEAATGNIESRVSAFQYKVAVTESESVSFKANGVSWQFKIELFDVDGSLISSTKGLSDSIGTYSLTSSGSGFVTLKISPDVPWVAYGTGSFEVGVFAGENATPTYLISPILPSVSEGSSASFSIETTNVSSGTLLSYSISGVSAADLTFGLLSGSTTVGSNGRATITVLICTET